MNTQNLKEMNENTISCLQIQFNSVVVELLYERNMTLVFVELVKDIPAAVIGP